MIESIFTLSLFRFMNNEIPYLCQGERKTKKIYYGNVDGQYPNTLSIGEKENFDSSELVCSMYKC